MLKKMTDRKKTVFISALLFILGFYLYYSLPYLKKDRTWEQIRVESLKLNENGKDISVKNGYLFESGRSRKIKFELNPVKLIENERVIRLALYYEINHRDPLFAGPGLGADTVNQSVQRLEKIHANLLRDLGLERNVVPIGYLKSFGKTVGATTVFSEKKTYPAALELTKLQRESSIKYGEDAQELARTLKKIFPENKALLQGGSLTTTDILQEDLEKILKNGKALKKEVSERSACLRVSSIFCHLEMPGEKDLIQAKASEGNTVLSPSELYFTKDPKDSTLKGPYQVETSCWNNQSGEDRARLVYLIEEKGKGFRRLIPKLATENYYQEIKPGSEEIIDIGYKNHDLVTRVMFETTPYNCNDLNYQPELATINYFKSNFKPDFFSRVEKESVFDGELRGIIEEGKKYETEFGKEKHPSKIALENLGQSYTKFYKALTQVRESSRDMEKNREEALERSLLIRRNLADFDGVINFFSYILDGYSQVEKAYGKEEKYDYIYSARSGYSLFYMAFSPSIWRIGEDPRFIDASKPQLRSDLLTREGVIKKYGKAYLDKATHLTRAEVWKELLGHFVE